MQIRNAHQIMGISYIDGEFVLELPDTVFRTPDPVAAARYMRFVNPGWPLRHLADTLWGARDDRKPFRDV